MQIPVLGVYFTSLHIVGLSEFFQFLRKQCKFPGDHIPGVPPVPISNTAVKPRVANGSRTLGPARVGRCQVYGPVLRKKDRASFLSVPRPDATLRICAKLDGHYLAAHSEFQARRGRSIQAKKRPGSSFDKPGHKPGNDLLSRDLTSYYHWLRGA